MTDRRFLSLLLFLLLAWLAVETIYIVRFPLIMDEFANAANAWRMHQQVPYRDFVPYKTVGGSALLLPLLFLPLSTWTNLILVKFEIAFITAAFLLAAAWLLRDRFDRRAIVASLAMLLAMSTFLERSAELRADGLTALAGLLSLVLLITDRPASSGALAALSFCISQKGVFYLSAGGAAYAIALLVASDRRATARALIRYVAACTAVIGAYVGLWSAIASFRSVMGATFLDAAKVALLNEYADLRLHFWHQTLTRNPFFYLFTLIAIAIAGTNAVRRRDPLAALLVGYGIAIVVQAVLHRQPWPYFFVIILPTFFVLHAFAAGALMRTHRGLLLTIVLLGGVALPLSRLSVTLFRDNSFQRANVDLAERVIGPGDRYLAGTDILYRRQQSIEQLAWIDRTVALALHRMSSRQVAALIRDVDATPTKLVIANYRTAGLPQPFPLYLESQYEHLWGNLFIYSPRIGPGTFDLKFGGDYLVEAHGDLEVDGRIVHDAATLSLRRGRHELRGGVARLKLQPRGVPSQSAPPRNFFPDVYEF